ncbi:MAG: hypothetical protein GXP48_01115, partial [Acidobacteria bacterium]|nr:hypothetical protein [Acidobacteriota bacterium]
MTDQDLPAVEVVAGKNENPKNLEESSVLAWWHEVIGDKNAPAGPRAELRRARTLEEVVFVPAFHDLRRRLAGTEWRTVDRLALVAGVLAHVRENDHSKTFAAHMGTPKPGGSKTPLVSPPRFRRLLR